MRPKLEIGAGTDRMSIDPRPTWTETLTEREIEILILLEDGFSNTFKRT
jgi:DNA-binding NarL/FixJ family response regulator